MSLPAFSNILGKEYAPYRLLNLPRLSSPLRGRRKFSPRQLKKLQAWYDTTDISSMLKSGGGAMTSGGSVALIADKSGNSAVNRLCLNGASGNYASFTALTAFGAGDFTVVWDGFVTSIASIQSLLGSDSNGFSLLVNTSGNPVTNKEGVGLNTPSTGVLSVLTRTVVTYTRSGTTGTYYLNGLAVGATITDNNNYSVGVGFIGAAAATGTPNKFSASVNRAVRVYPTALSAAAVLADSNGNLQVGITLNAAFSLFAKLNSSGVAATGQTITVNTSGDLGARISGERDLVQLTAANQPVWTLGAGMLFDGTNDYMKAAAFSLSQPETVYFVGQQVTWTATDNFFDGNGADSSVLEQNSTTPQLALRSSVGAAAANTGLAVATNAVMSAIFNGASSSLRVNRTIATTGNPGNTAANGYTLASRADGTRNGNIRANEIAIYSVAATTAQQNAFINYAMSKWRIS